MTDITAGPGSVELEPVKRRVLAEVPADRVVALDAARGFAVFGMLLRNVFVFGMPSTAYGLPLIWSGEVLADIWSWAFVELFVDGSMRGLFSLLFGASALMLLQRAEQAGTGLDPYFRRLLWIMAFGVVHAYLLLSPIDVLFVYGILGLFIYPLRNLSPRTLLSTAGAMLLAVTVLSAASLYLIDEGTDQAASTQTEATEQTAKADQPADDVKEEEEQLLQSWALDIAERSESYLYNVLSLSAMSYENHATDLFKHHLIDVGMLILIGMALFKLGIVTGACSTRFYVVLLAACYGSGLALNFAETYSEFVMARQTLSADGWPLVTYDIGRALMSVGHLALIVLISRWRFISLVTSLLSAAGRLALTNYILQTVILVTLFFGHGFGLFGEFQHAQLLAIGLAIGVLQMIASAIYLRRFRQGPCEWLLRRLVLWRRPAAVVG